jgi:hypothetical protein
MADTWRYRFYQMQNGQPGFTSESHLFDLPMNQVTFTTILQNTGSWSGKLQATDPAVKGALAGLPPLHLLCDRTAVYVELNGQLVYGGILQQVSYDSLAQQITLQGMDWWGYFNNGRIINWNANYTGTDQLLIAADLMNIAQGAASSSAQTPALAANTVVAGSVGVLLGQIPTAALAGSYSSGNPQTQAWAASAYKPIGQAISDLGSSANGFDWTIDIAYVNGVPTKTFNLWYPRSGRTQQQQQTAGSAVTFDMGSSSGQKYVWVAGEIQTANILYGAGSGAGNTSITSEASAPVMWGQGYPLLQQSVSYTDILTQTLLDYVTQGNLIGLEYPVSQPQIQYNAGTDSNQPVGSYAIGDDVRLIIPPDPYFGTSGYDSEGTSTGEQWWRIQQVSVTVNDDGKSYQTLTLGTPPVFPGE